MRTQSILWIDVTETATRNNERSEFQHSRKWLRLVRVSTSTVHTSSRTRKCCNFSQKRATPARRLPWWVSLVERKKSLDYRNTSQQVVCVCTVHTVSRYLLYKIHFLNHNVEWYQQTYTGCFEVWNQTGCWRGLNTEENIVYLNKINESTTEKWCMYCTWIAQSPSVALCYPMTMSQCDLSSWTVDLLGIAGLLLDCLH